MLWIRHSWLTLLKMRFCRVPQSVPRAETLCSLPLLSLTRQFKQEHVGENAHILTVSRVSVPELCGDIHCFWLSFPSLLKLRPGWWEAEAQGCDWGQATPTLKACLRGAASQNFWGPWKWSESTKAHGYWWQLKTTLHQNSPSEIQCVSFV